MPAVRSRGRTDATQGKPRPDAYVGLLILSMVALITAMVFAYLNWDAVKEKPKPVQLAPISSGGARTPAPPGPGVAPPPGGQMQPGGAPAPGVPGATGAPGGVNPPPPPPPAQPK